MTSGSLLVEYRETAMCPQTKPVRRWSTPLPYPINGRDAHHSGAVLGRADEAPGGLRVSLPFLTCAGRRSAHFRMASSAGHRDYPHVVRLYSTFGGTCGYEVRSTMPSASMAFSCCPSIFCVMAGMARSRSENRIIFSPNRGTKNTTLQR